MALVSNSSEDRHSASNAPRVSLHDLALADLTAAASLLHRRRKMHYLRLMSLVIMARCCPDVEPAELIAAFHGQFVSGSN